jgi:PAS domain S-box-containing protein
VLALMAGLAALAYARDWHWWKHARTVDIAELAEAARGNPVRLEGDVTYHDAQYAVAVVQDDSAAIAVAVPRDVTIEAGQRIQLSGILPKAYDPTAPVPLSLEGAEFTTLQDRISLPTRKVAISDLFWGVEPGRFEVAGIVKSVREQDRRMVLDVTGDGASITAIFIRASRAELSNLIDAKVALRGVRFVAITPTVSWNLLLSDSSDVTVIEPPAAHPALVSSLQALLAEPAWCASGHRIRARGLVLKPLSGNSLLLTDGTVSIPVESTSRLDAKAGTVVEVEGWPVSSQHAVVLQGARIVSAGVTLPSAAERTPLTSSEQIQHLSSADAARAYPVHISGVVTAANTLLGIVFLQDKSGGIYVRAPNQPLPLVLGQHLAVRGVTSSGDFAPIVTNAILEPGAAGALPAPATVTAEDLNSGSLDSMWVQIEGKVHTVEMPLPGLFTFKLITSMGPAVEISAADLPPGLDLHSLTDAKVRIEGVLGPVVNADGQVVGRRLAAFPLTRIHVLAAPPANPFTVQPHPIGELLHHARYSNGNRTHVSGTVVMQRGNDIYIEDSTGGLLVESKNVPFQARNVQIKPGEIVSAVGYASPGIYGPKLTEAEIRKTGRAATPKAPLITSGQAMSGKFEYRLVQIEARVLSQIAGSRQQNLVLQSGGNSFEAEVFQRAPLSLTEGSTVKLTGVLTVQSVVSGATLVPSAFRILVPDAGHIEVVRAAPWWNARNATLLFGAMACGTLLVLAWVWSLRRRVRVQTHEIEEQGEFLRQVIDIAPNFIFVKDTEGRFTLANRALAEVYQTTPDEMIGKTVEQISGTTADAICGSQDDQDVIATLREKYVAEESHVDTDGNHRWVQITKRPILDASDRAVGVLGVANDITQRKRDEERLIQARVAAEAANTAKSEFLANMSHEIRTPLNGVIGMLDLLDRDAFDPEQRSMLETARSSADALLTLINDVLDFSKIEAGKLALEQIDLELAPLVEEVATLFSRQAHAKGIELSCLVHRDVPAVVRGDPTRLRQILANLVSNAIKFTERGEVFISLQVTGTAAVEGIGTAALLRAEIRDTGIGMSEEVIGRLFQAFTQADSSTTRRYGGTGLGLTIARRLVDAMQGTLEVTSEAGKGSTFSVTLPLRVTKQATNAAQPADLRGLRALIVDDNPTNRLILEHYLTAAGMQHVSAASARLGLEAASSAAKSGAPFDIVLLDYQMPEMDGLGFISSLRADPTIASIPCVVLSSLGDRGGLPDSVGVSAWLGKPVRQAALLRILATIVGNTAIREQFVRKLAAEQFTFPGARVLVAEDNPVNQKVALRVLAAFGLKAELAVNGAEALARVKTEHFDAILMDCQMPVIDGYAASRAIREWERATAGRHIPIIAMTANALAGDRARCLAAGMDDHVAKPFKREALGATLAKWLRRGANEADAGGLPETLNSIPAS